MPGFNQKGPDGAGAMTGRQGGMCRRTENPSLGSNRGGGLGTRGSGGRGMGSRCGQGQGQGRRFDRDAGQPQSMAADRSRSEELRDLKEQYKAAMETLKMIEQKIAALENGK